MKHREIRAEYDANTITVYQAYNKSIALPAIENNKFGEAYSFTRMTWIKPSYLWMMERSGWGTKSNQEYILAIKLKRACWEKALSLAVLSHPEKGVYPDGMDWRKMIKRAKVVIQWDPERTLRGGKLDERAIQVGISRHLIEEYNDEWIEEISDITPLTRNIYQLKMAGKYPEAKRLLPKEKVYPVDPEIEKRIGIR